jgi:hypothetical protein
MEVLYESHDKFFSSQSIFVFDCSIIELFYLFLCLFRCLFRCWCWCWC